EIRPDLKLVPRAYSIGRVEHYVEPAIAPRQFPALGNGPVGGDLGTVGMASEGIPQGYGKFQVRYGTHAKSGGPGNAATEVVVQIVEGSQVEGQTAVILEALTGLIG